MEIIETLLVDDEPPARAELKFLLAPYPDLRVAGEAEDGISALEIYRELQPSVVFLDIQIPGIQGMELAASLSRFAEPPFIVFVTAYDSYAVRAFELNALDYLLKPISEERFALAVERIRETFRDRQGRYRDYLRGLRALLDGYGSGATDGEPIDDGAAASHGAAPADFITIYKDGRYKPVPYRAIACLKADGGATRVFAEDGEYLVNRPFQEFVETLPTRVFFQAHRSYLANLGFVGHVDLWINGALQLELRCVPEPVPVSRGRAKELRRRLNMQ